MSDEKLSMPPCGSRSGTTHGYTVEARYNYPSPKQFGDIILDKDWRPLHFVESQIGVPARGAKYAGGTEREAMGLLCYPAAEALRWWFLAQCDADMAFLCVETRIIEHVIKYSMSVEAIRATSVVDGSQMIAPPKEAQHDQA